MTTWEEVQVPRGAYLGWGAKKGQHVTGKVLEYSPDGGTTFAGDPCPSATIELTEKAASFNKDGERTDHEAGTIIQLNAGQVSLKRALRAADPSPGDLVKITLVNLAKTDKGSVKEFNIQIARGAGGSAKPTPAAAAEDLDDDEPPF
jgi:hypothetical protein